jgi:inner membrane protein
VDSLTHALVIAIALSLAGRPDLIPYGISGAVLIDVDVLFNGLSDRDPGLYIFTHGGFTHSFFGAFFVVLFAAIIAFLLSNVTSMKELMAPFGIAAFAAIAAGALSHVMVDYLAYPGIPLLYPLSDKKQTLGILGGPSVFIMLASIAYIAAMAAGMAQMDRPWLFVSFFALVVALSAGAKACVAFSLMLFAGANSSRNSSTRIRARTKRRTIATLNPFKWAVIEDTPNAYLYYQCDLLGRRSTAEAYAKYQGITPVDAGKNDGMPEVRRLRYHSYIVTVEMDGEGITYRDPIREKGHIWYPPYYKKYRITASGR